MAPKSNTGGNAQNVKAGEQTPEQLAAIEALNKQQDGGQSGTEAKAPIPTVTKVLTAQEIMDEATAKLDAAKSAVKAARSDESVTDEAMMELSLAVFNAKQGVEKAQKGLDAEADRQKQIEALNAEIAKLDTYDAARDAHTAAQVVYNASAKTPEDIAASNAAYEAYKAARSVITDVLTARFPKSNNGSTRTVTATTGTTGGTKGGLSKAILAGYKSLRLSGKTDTEARKALIDGSHDGTKYNDGTVGNVVKPYKDAPDTIPA